MSAHLHVFLKMLRIAYLHSSQLKNQINNKQTPERKNRTCYERKNS